MSISSSNCDEHEIGGIEAEEENGPSTNDFFEEENFETGEDITAKGAWSSNTSSCSSQTGSESSADSSFSSSDSSQNTSLSDSTSSSAESPPHKSHHNKRFIRQRRLLEKVANLGSSPINVIQAIAAKALNFKLKNAIPFEELAEQQQQQMDAASCSQTSGSGDKSVRLMRQYRMMRATNMVGAQEEGERASTSREAAAREERRTKNKRLKESTAEDDVEMQAQQTTNLFSVLRYWMSKRGEEAKAERQSEEKAVFEIDERLLHKKLSSLEKKRVRHPKDYSLSVETINLSNLQHLSLRNLGVNVIEVNFFFDLKN